MKENKVKILIVDDDTRLLRAMQETLEAKGCYVQTASSRGDALKMLFSQYFHLALIDCVLLSEQGTDLVQEIRKYLGHSVDIVMMSGIVPAGSISGLVDMYSFDFLRKPLTSTSLNKHINRVKEKIMFGVDDHVLLKNFDSNVSSTYKLKNLVSLKKSDPVNFFLSLITCLESKESVRLSFSFEEGKEETLFFEDGLFVNYTNDHNPLLLNFLIEEGFLAKSEVEKFQDTPSEEVFKELIQNCFISSHQISDLKIKILEKTFKKILKGKSVSVKYDIFVKEKSENLFELDQDYLANFIFKNSTVEFNKEFKELINSDIMDLSLKFENNNIQYFVDLEKFIYELKSGLKIKNLYRKYDNFYSFLFYVLSKGGVSFSRSKNNIKYFHLYERYAKLQSFLKNNSSEYIFKILGNKEEDLSGINANAVRDAYLSFVKFNHSDKFPQDIPQDLSQMINNVTVLLKGHQDSITDPQLRQKIEKEEKDKKMEKEILIIEQRKACKIFLEKKDYNQSFSILQEVPKNLLDKELSFQLLYLWLGFASPSIGVDQEKMKIFMQNVNKHSNDLKRNYQYYYVLGLYYESKEEYEKALSCYDKVKILDSSFKPVYASIKKVVILERQKKKNKNSLSKIMSQFSSLKKKAS